MAEVEPGHRYRWIEEGFDHGIVTVVHPALRPHTWFVRDDDGVLHRVAADELVALDPDV